MRLAHLTLVGVLLATPVAPSVALAARADVRLGVPKARGPVRTVAGQPRTFLGRMGRGVLRLGSGVARLGGFGAAVFGAATFNPMLATGGVALMVGGDVGGDLAHAWGGTRVARDGRPIPKMHGLGGLLSKGTRATSFVGRKAGMGAMMFGLASLNPVLIGGGAATWLGGRIVGGIEHRFALRALNKRAEL